jgi:hypothetical protein
MAKMDNNEKKNITTIVMYRAAIAAKKIKSKMLGRLPSVYFKIEVAFRLLLTLLLFKLSLAKIGEH